jgi:hypothetical protein
MARKYRLWALMLAGVVVVSCSPRTVLLPSSDTSNFTDKEKEVRNTSYRDSLLKILLAKESKSNAIVIVDSVKSATAGLLNSPVSHLTTEHAASNAWVENGVLRHDLFTTNEEFNHRVPNAIKEVSVDRFRYINKTRTIKILVTVNVLTSAQERWIKVGKMATGIAAMLILCIAGYFTIKIRR